MKIPKGKDVIWVCEAKMNDGKWYMMAGWGAGKTRRTAIEKVKSYCALNTIEWAYDELNNKLKRSIRFTKHFIDKPKQNS